MTSPVLHVVFNPSGAAGLRDALRMVGRDDRVIALFDSLSFGPIDPPDANTRTRWVEDELGYDWDDVTARSELFFWRDALSPDCRRVVWMTRRSANEYASFLEYIWRLGDMTCDVIDMTDVMISRRQDGFPTKPELAVSVATLPPYAINDNALYDLAEPLRASAKDRYRSLWRQLRAENAPLRIIKDGTLASAPITFFDSILLSFVNNDWQKTALIVGKALAAEMDDCIYQTGDLVLAARIRSLAEAGAIESRGDLANIQASEVRFPS